MVFFHLLSAYCSKRVVKENLETGKHIERPQDAKGAGKVALRDVFHLFYLRLFGKGSHLEAKIFILP